MRAHRRGARGVAVTAVLAALSLILLYLSAFVPAGQMGVVAIAGLVPAGAVISAGLGAGFCCYGVAGLLGLLLVPDKGGVLLYLIFFGLYPMIKSLIEQLRRRPLEYVLKLIFFNAAFTVIYLVMKNAVLASLPEVLSVVWILYVVANIVFLLYDYGFSKLISAYIARIHRAVR